MPQKVRLLSVGTKLNNRKIEFDKNNFSVKLFL